MKLYQDDNTRKAFVMYVLGSVNTWGVCQHDRFDSDEGLQWAKGLIESAFWKVTERACDNYAQLGSFSIYQGQDLTPENRVFMDLFEALIFGDNTTGKNRAEELPKEITQRIGLSIHTIHRLLTSNKLDEKKEKAEGAKAYDEMFKEKQESARKADTSLGIGYLRFYIKWRFPIGFIVGALSILSSIAQGAMYGLFSVGLFSVFLVIDIAIYIFRIFVYGKMVDMTRKGYEENNILLFLETLYMALNRAWLNHSNDLIYGLAITIPIAFLIWWLPNHIYFKHREHLFTGIVSIDALTSDYGKGNNSDSNEKTERQAVNKFYCKACGHNSTGWYQACPNCGTVGKMEKVSPTQQKRLEKAVKPSEQPATESPVLFCRECGTRLRPDAAFCSECGTPIAVLPQPKEAAPQPVKQMQQEPNQGVFYTPARRPEPISIDLHDKSLSPALRRAFLFAEDGDWARADEYLEKVLDEDPENAYAYLGKLLVELQVEELEGLAQKVDEVKNSRNYKRALRYSDEKLKKYLTSISSETELQNNSEQTAPTVSEEAKMRSLFPDDYDLLVRFWASLYFVKETSREEDLPEIVAKQIENGLWDGMKRNYGAAEVDQAKHFLAAVDGNRLAEELNVLERMSYGDKAFSMQWRDGEKPKVAIDISKLE